VLVKMFNDLTQAARSYKHKHGRSPTLMIDDTNCIARLDLEILCQLLIAKMTADP